MSHPTDQPPGEPRPVRPTRFRWLGLVAVTGLVGVVAVLVSRLVPDRAPVAREKQLVRDPAEVAAIARVAVSFYMEGQLEHAREAFLDALQENPDPDLEAHDIPRATFWGDLIGTFLDLGDPEQARRIIEAGLQARPNDPLLLDGLATIAWHEGEAVEAEAIWERVRELNPAMGSPWLGLGRIELARGQLATAIERLEAATLRLPDDPEAWYVLSQAYRASGRAEPAGEALARSEAIRARMPARRRGMDAMSGPRL